MWPVLLTWRGMALRSYSVIIYLALLTTVLLTAAFAGRNGLDADRAAWAVLLAYIPGFIGARLMYVARHWDDFRDDPRRILQRGQGGVSLHGGIIGMVLGLLPLLWLFGLPPARFFDALVLGMLGGIAVAKAACLLNGCCHGHITGHWCGMHLPDQHGVWSKRFPSPLLEMLWALFVLSVLLIGQRYAPAPGLIACAAFVLHPAGRIVLQGLRDEGPAEDAAVRKVSLLMIAVALAAGLFIGL